MSLPRARVDLARCGPWSAVITRAPGGRPTAAPALKRAHRPKETFSVVTTLAGARYRLKMKMRFRFFVGDNAHRRRVCDTRMNLILDIPFLGHALSCYHVCTPRVASLPAATFVHHTATLPRCHAATLPRCHAATLPRCRAAALPRCHAATFERRRCRIGRRRTTPPVAMRAGDLTIVGCISTLFITPSIMN